jgi:hypothetical protein
MSRISPEALALRRGLDLAAERIVILPVGGAANTGRFSMPRLRANPILPGC